MEINGVTQNQDPPELKPLDIGGILDTSIKLTKRIFKPSAVILLIVALPLTLLAAIAQTDLINDGDTARTGGAIAAILVFAFLQALFVPVALTSVASNNYLNKEITWQAGLALGFRRSPRTFVLFLLAMLALSVAYALLILPGIWLSVAWSLCVTALVVEDLGATASLSRSFQLVKDRWWATFGTIFVGYLLVSVSLSIISALASSIATGVGPIDSIGYQLITNGVNFVITLVTAPFIVALLVVIYFDLRVRKEAFDLALRSQGSDPADLGLAPLPPAPAPAAPPTTPSLPTTPSVPTTPPSPGTTPPSPPTPPPPPPPPPA